MLSTIVNSSQVNMAGKGLPIKTTGKRIVPDRFNSISKPVNGSIVAGELNSISKAIRKAENRTSK